VSWYTCYSSTLGTTGTLNSMLPPKSHRKHVSKPLYLEHLCSQYHFFWFGWTSYPSIPLWSPLMAGGLMGLSIFLIFLSLINYTVDAYLFAAASALAASTVSRSIFGAVFPLFARQMFETLNPRWASTILGFVAITMIPIPIVLRRYGPYLRSRSRFAPSEPPAKVATSSV